MTFLVGPEIDLTDVTEAHITINHALNYERGDINANNSIVISKDYAGDVTTATWQVLNYNTDGLGNSFTFVENNVNIRPNIWEARQSSHCATHAVRHNLPHGR